MNREKYDLKEIIKLARKRFGILDEEKCENPDDMISDEALRERIKVELKILTNRKGIPLWDASEMDGKTHMFSPSDVERLFASAPLETYLLKRSDKIEMQKLLQRKKELKELNIAHYKQLAETDWEELHEEVNNPYTYRETYVGEEKINSGILFGMVEALFKLHFEPFQREQYKEDAHYMENYHPHDMNRDFNENDMEVLERWSDKGNYCEQLSEDVVMKKLHDKIMSDDFLDKLANKLVSKMK